MKIQYRIMETRDVPGIFKVDQACFNHNWTEESYLEETKNMLSNYVVAETGAEIIGFGGFWQIIDEAHITNIAVLSAYRNMGVGQGIMNALYALARDKGCISMTLEVRASNEPAISFYLKNHFIQEGQRKDYYGNGLDGLIMWRYGLE
jgi:ribosomal-protein-alanine N-acetyltransferase